MVKLAGIGKANPSPQCVSISVKGISVPSKVEGAWYNLRKLAGFPDNSAMLRSQHCALLQGLDILL